MASSRKRAARLLLAAIMVGIGVMHFLFPGDFAAIVPAWLPAPRLLVLVSGACEIAGGLGLLVPSLRRAASWGLILLYVAIFPANLNMALHQIPVHGVAMAPILLWARLPVQLVFIAWAWWVGRDDRGGGVRG